MDKETAIANGEEDGWNHAFNENPFPNDADIEREFDCFNEMYAANRQEVIPEEFFEDYAKAFKRGYREGCAR